MKTKEQVKNKILSLSIKISNYEKRIESRKNKPCYFDETKSIEIYEDYIEIYKEQIELLRWVLSNENN